MDGSRCSRGESRLKDLGPEPAVVNLERAVFCNGTFRTALWTGKHLQLTVMCIPVGGEIGVEIHENTDQFLRIESGCALVKMGSAPNNLATQHRADSNSGIFIPAGTWHNVFNAGSVPLRLYSVYAPPQHPFGTVHVTKRDADRGE